MLRGRGAWWDVAWLLTNTCKYVSIVYWNIIQKVPTFPQADVTAIHVPQKIVWKSGMCTQNWGLNNLLCKSLIKFPTFRQDLSRSEGGINADLPIKYYISYYNSIAINLAGTRAASGVMNRGSPSWSAVVSFFIYISIFRHNFAENGPRDLEMVQSDASSSSTQSVTKISP